MLAIAATGIAAFVLSLVAVELTRLREGVALLWLANAPLVATLCVVPRSRRLPHIAAWFIGTTSVAWLFSPLSFLSLVLATINLTEVCIATWVLQRAHCADDPFADGKAIIAFVAAALVSASVSGVLTGWMAINLLHAPFASLWFDWTLAHALGHLTIMPLAMLFVRRDVDWGRFRRRGSLAGAVAMLAAVAGTAGIAFGQSQLPLLFLTILPLLAATFTFGRIGAAAGIVAVTMVGGLMTIHGTGPMMLIDGDQAMRLQFFDFYVAVLFMIALPVATMLKRRDQLAQALGEREAFYRLLTEHSTDMMLTTSPDGIVKFISPVVRDLLGYEPDAMIGRHARDVILPEDWSKVAAVHDAAIAAPEEVHRVDYRLVRADGSIDWFESNIRAVVPEDGDVATVVSVIRDLSDRKHREDALMRAATSDPLTGLANRTAFRNAVAAAIDGVAPGAPATLALLDLDHFKRVNDMHGHATGDAALLMLADLLRDNLRGEDVIGRIGGEEFGILFPGLSMASAGVVCRRLCSLLADARLPTPDGRSITITASIGLATLARDGNIDASFRSADHALYAAKNAGRNRIQLAEAATA